MRACAHPAQATQPGSWGRRRNRVARDADGSDSVLPSIQLDPLDLYSLSDPGDQYFLPDLEHLFAQLARSHQLDLPDLLYQLDLLVLLRQLLL